MVDPNYNIPLSPLDGLPPDPVISSTFNSSPLQINEFESILQSRRNASSPGINQIPYKIYKKCPQIASFLFRMFCLCLRNSVIPVQWRVSSETYIPKTKQPKQDCIKEFRPIALLNVEGKLFFSLISRRLEKHIVKNNKFINLSIQKGCMEKVPGCWEHMSTAWNSLKTAKAEKSDLAAVWLDIANAYGSVPHKLIFFALKRYGVPENWIRIIQIYYSGLWSKCFSQASPSSWHLHMKGIFTGCTISIILFLSAMNVIIEFSTLSTAPFSNSSPQPMKAFMDDLYLWAKSVLETQNLLNRCNTALRWAGMSFRAQKSRSLVLSKGVVVHDSPFSIKSAEGLSVLIPSINDQLIRFLGRTITHKLSDTECIQKFFLVFLGGLEAINKSFHCGTHKLWILYHHLIPRIRWSFKFMKCQ